MEGEPEGGRADAGLDPASGGASVPPVSESDCPPGYPVKGNQSGIYHDVDSPYYDATNPEECYADAADAENAGYRPPKR